ncbi:hypothetical protein ACS0TY_032682 [Phlomoides rotata]
MVHGRGRVHWCMRTSEVDSRNSSVESLPQKPIICLDKEHPYIMVYKRHRWIGDMRHIFGIIFAEGRDKPGKKGKEVMKEEKAARAYDLATLKYQGTNTTTNFPLTSIRKNWRK